LLVNVNIGATFQDFHSGVLRSSIKFCLFIHIQSDMFSHMLVLQITTPSCSPKHRY